MQQKRQRPTAIFSICAPSDIHALERWEAHLYPLERADIISIWSVRHLQPGTDRLKKLHDRLDQAQIIILLLSADFFTDEECYSLMERALERHQQDIVRVIPLLVRPVAFRETKLALLTPLPSDGRPITLWEDIEAAFDDCVRDLRRILGRPITAPLTRQQKHTSGNDREEKDLKTSHFSREYTIRNDGPVQNQVIGDYANVNLFFNAQKEPDQYQKSREKKDRVRMLLRLQNNYEQILVQSLQGVTPIELDLKDKPIAVQNAANLLFRTGSQTGQLLPPGTSILNAYDKAAHELLILGAPGSGKSTLAVDLARQLVRRAEQDDTHPLPVVVPLSYWAVEKRLLHLWLAEQVAQIYNVPLKIARLWIDEDKLLPILDGLDEMEEAARPSCIEAINAYHRAHLSHPLVVCSRQDEYDLASRNQRLALQNAVIVQPLTHEQVQTYLNQAYEDLLSLRRLLSINQTLAKIATTPLMVHILILTYQGTSVQQLSTDQEQLQQQIWTDYLARMVERKGNTPLKQTRAFLGWLAQQMRDHDQTNFYLEGLQPDWLSEKQQRTYALLGVRLPSIIIGALVSILLGWFFFYVSGWIAVSEWRELPRDIMLGGVIGDLLCPIMLSASSSAVTWTRQRQGISLGICVGVGLVIGFSIGWGTDTTLKQWLADGVIYGVLLSMGSFFLHKVLLVPPRSTLSVSRQRSGRWVNLVHLVRRVHLGRALLVTLVIGLSYGLSYWLNYELSYGLSTGLSAGLDYQMNAGLSFGLSHGLNAGLCFGLTSILTSVIFGHLQDEILLRERVSFSWRNLGKHLFAPNHLYPALLVAGLLAIYFVVSAELDYGSSHALSFGLSFGLCFGPCFGLLYWLLLGLYRNIGQERIEEQDRQVLNQGIQQSLYNSVILSPIIGTMIVGTGILAYGLSFGLNAGLSSGLSYGLNYGLSYGLNYGLSYFWPLFIASIILIWIIMGGLVIWRHYLIRFLLRLEQTFPWEVPQFLNEAKTRILLERVGGGYRFIHRLLRDFLAETYDYEQTSS